MTIDRRSAFGVLMEGGRPDGPRVSVFRSLRLEAHGFHWMSWPVRKNWHSAQTLIWFWVVIEMIDGVGHPAWSVRQGGYTPGVITAPIPLVLAVYLAFRLRRAPPPVSRVA